MLKVIVDTDICQAHGECCRIAPDLFELDADFELSWTERPDEPRRADLEYAVDSCPAGAISLDDTERD